MKKKLFSLALLFLFLLRAVLADQAVLQDLQSMDPYDFAQKYITATQNGFQLYEKLAEELGDFDFWSQIHKKQLRNTLPYWENLEMERQGKVSDFRYSNSLFYFFFAEDYTKRSVSEEDAREMAVAWAVEKGLLSQEDLPNTKVAASLVSGDYILGGYPNLMWNIRLHGAWDEPIEVWLSARTGKLSNHTSIELLSKGKQSLLEQLKAGLYLATYSNETGLLVVTPEDVEGWYTFAVYYPSRNQWRVVFDKGNDSYYWLTFSDSDLEEIGEIDGGNG